MKRISRSVVLAGIGVALSTFSESADAATLEGIVKDAAGHPIKGAVVRVEAKKVSKVVNTDARGHYAVEDLGVAAYKVTVLVNGQVKASIPDARTQNKKSTQLNFNLTGKSMAMAPAKGKTHMVYVPGETGTLTHKGGQWVQVDENGVPVDNKQRGNMENVEKSNGMELQSMGRSNRPRGN
jgi:hypothetical protein